MKSLLFVATCVAAFISSGPSRPTIAAENPAVVVRGPTIVAFFPPVTEEQLAKDSDTNEVLADFQFYAGQVRKPLGDMGIEFHELYAHSFQLRNGKRLTRFQPAKIKVGFCFVAPGRKPHIEYGVMTDTDLLSAAKKYFGIPSK